MNYFKINNNNNNIVERGTWQNYITYIFIIIVHYNLILYEHNTL